MGIFARKLKILFTNQNYLSAFMTPSQLTVDKIRQGKFSNLVLDREDLENLEHFRKICQHIYDNNLRDPIIGPKDITEYTETLERFYKGIYTRGFNEELTKHMNLPDFIKENTGHGVNNTYMWFRACPKLNAQPYLVIVNDLEKLERESNKMLLKLLLEFDIHIQTESKTKYPEEWLAHLLKHNRVVIGHDDNLDKVLFAIMPFLIREIKYLEGLFDRQGKKGIYFQELLDFSQRNGQKITEMIPDFVSYPADQEITPEFIGLMLDFFKGKTKKVIVKTNVGAASGGNYLTYLILDVDDPQAADMWLTELNTYRSKYITYCDFAKKKYSDDPKETENWEKTKKSPIMIQAMLVEHDTDHPYKNEFTEHLHLAAHKQNVVGDNIWRYGIKFIMLTRHSHFQTGDPKSMAVIEQCLHATSDLTIHDGPLQIAGEYLNLISPMGCHALDIVFGKLGKKKDAGISLFLLEANPSYVRGDIQGTNYWTKQDVMEEYLRWATTHFNGDPDAAGKYSRKIFQELDAEAREEFIKNVHDLWAFVNSIIQRYVFFCSSKKPKVMCIPVENMKKLARKDKTSKERLSLQISA
jgi:hypothetical protein